jgi:hypothetical protein
MGNFFSFYAYHVKNYILYFVFLNEWFAFIGLNLEGAVK